MTGRGFGPGGSGRVFLAKTIWRICATRPAPRTARHSEDSDIAIVVCTSQLNDRVDPGDKKNSNRALEAVTRDSRYLIACARDTKP